MLMKKRILYIAAIVFCLAILTNGSLAYFTADDTARNVITSGGVDVKIIEQQLTDGNLQPYPSQRIQVMPDTVVSKIVSVQSVEQAAWIRANYEVAVYDAAGNPKDIPADELARVIAIESDNADWSLQDGWWYYNQAVKAGEMTTPLFENVAFSGQEMGNEYQNCSIEIIITAQAVQCANNGSSVTEAVGWPEE